MFEEFGNDIGNLCKVKDQLFYFGQELMWLKTSVCIYIHAHNGILLSHKRMR